MKILGLVGSPRKGGNTDLLVEEVLKGSAKNNHTTEKIYLYNVDIAPCIDCKACKKGKLEWVLKDGMRELYPKLEEADVIVFGTPLYWYGPSGKMKLLIDRLRPFVESKKLKGKRVVLVVPSEEGADSCNHIVGMFNLSFKYLEIEITSILLPKASDKGEVKQQPQTLKEAMMLGKHIK